MFGWFKKIKERAAEDARLQSQQDLARSTYVSDLLTKRREAMLAKPCPMRGMIPCTKECVHFKDGYTYDVPRFNGDGFVPMIENPSCKLWRK